MLTKSKLDTVEGTWEEISGLAPELIGRRLRVTILPDTPQPKTTFLAKGIFPQLSAISDDDFKSAEFHADPDDGLHWRI